MQNFNFRIIFFLLIAVLFFPSLAFSDDSNLEEITLFPTEDGYVITDLDDPTDENQLNSINTGDFDFLKIWYATKIPGAETNKFVSIGYLKFDLSNVGSDTNDEEQDKESSDGVTSAKLRLYARELTFPGIPRVLNIHSTQSSSWQEFTLTYENAPIFSKDPIATNLTNNSGWYEWNVTDFVKQNKDNEITFVVMYRDVIEGFEEQIIFESKETSDQELVPNLIVTKNMSTILEDGNITGQNNDDLYFILLLLVIPIAGGMTVFYFKKKKSIKTWFNFVHKKDLVLIVLVRVLVDSLLKD